MDEVAPREIGNALVALCREAWSISEDDLMADALALFGWKRRTAATVRPVQFALERCLTEERLTRDGQGLLRARDG
jgi:hypothetical protein